MRRLKQDFLLVALNDSLMKARLKLLLDKSNEALVEVDFCLKLIEIINEITISSPKSRVFNFKVLSEKQNAMVVSDMEILRQALLVLEKYADIEYKKRGLKIIFQDKQNLILKQLFVELLAEKTDAEYKKGRNYFSLSFRPAYQASFWN